MNSLGPQSALDALSDITERREFEFSEEDFQYIQDFMHRETGIYLSDRKMSMVYGRLARRLRRCSLTRFSDYFLLIERDKDEKVAFINALTTNKTQFFRENHHFEYMSSILIPEWRRQQKKRIRIWSAGCSTGEEPYSIASCVSYHGMLANNIDIRILATDLDTQVLETAKNGTYSADAIDSIPDHYLRSGFIKGRGKKQELLKVKSELKKIITFNKLNLTGEWPLKGEFDAIFCRNVMIYFEKETQQQLLQRFWGKLVSGGVLFIGHSESIGKIGNKFENLGQTMYRKP